MSNATQLRELLATLGPPDESVEPICGDGIAGLTDADTLRQVHAGHTVLISRRRVHRIIAELEKTQ